MKRRSLPIWLLRDVPAFLGVMFSFWPLVILLITSARRAMRGKKVRWAALDEFPLLLAHAEARLAFALRRQAYRRLGWNPRRVPFELIPATDTWEETVERYLNYSRALRDMNAVVEAYIDSIRSQYSISERDLVAHGSTDARLSRAAHHELVGAATRARATSPLALILSSARSARPSKDKRGYARARGPPLRSRLMKIQPNPPRTPRARGRTRMRKQKPRRAFALRGHVVCAFRQIS